MHNTVAIASSGRSARRVRHAAFALLFSSVAVAGGCGDDDNNDNKNNETTRPDLTGAECASPADCYPGVDQTMLSGEVRCLSDVRDGYCTHVCSTDTDCCKVEGECKTDLRQVCAPFESTSGNMCFLSCEPEDLRNPDGTMGTNIDDQEYCQRAAGSDFICRASGGGDPRKICMPADCGVGADCTDVADCASGLECITAYDGGYCGKTCSVNADCPRDSVCAQGKNGNYCLRTCTANSDCTLCRDPRFPGQCTDQVTFVDTTTVAGTTVCIP